jgi:predicted O-methyltransferase YrrM
LKKFNNRLDIPGMTFPRELDILSNIASLVPEGGKILEIGSCFGRSAHALYTGKKETVKLTCLDLWGDTIPFPENSYHGSKELLNDAINISFERQNSRYGFEYILGSEIINDIEIIQDSSSNLKDFNFDLVFIDGDHNYSSVSTDINNFVFNSNTLILGDDANQSNWDVIKAIWDNKRNRTLIVPSGQDVKFFALIPPNGYWVDHSNSILEILRYEF